MSTVTEELASELFNSDGMAEPFIKAVKAGNRKLAKKLLNHSMLTNVGGGKITDEELDEVIREYGLG